MTQKGFSRGKLEATSIFALLTAMAATSAPATAAAPLQEVSAETIINMPDALTKAKYAGADGKEVTVEFGSPAACMLHLLDNVRDNRMNAFRNPSGRCETATQPTVLVVPSFDKNSLAWSVNEAKFFLLPAKTNAKPSAP